jgi:hypothetical protein
MRNVKHITVVPLDLYRQTRRLAAEYDTTVTALVAYLLERLPIHVQKARLPKGGIKHRRVRGPGELEPLPHLIYRKFHCETVRWLQLT